MSGERLIFNGIDGETGDYLLAPMSEEELLQTLRRKRRPEEQARSRGFEGDTKDLAAAGWGVVFPEDGDPAVREALAELLEHREKLASKEDPRRFKVLTYKRGESRRGFLERNGVGWGPVVPSEMPYYLLLVGDPAEIPYELQHELDVGYAVGRVALDTADGYASYAASVVRAEQGKLVRPPRAVLFGVRNHDDGATSLSADDLVAPLGESLAASHPQWEITALLAEEATKGRLGSLLDEEAPAFLFTASHGMGFPLGDPRQPVSQGALLCQDWPGPSGWKGRIPEEHYFGARDVSDKARLGGMVAFCFACYGAGTPEKDDFAPQEGAPLEVVEARRLAPRPLVSPLPQRLLSHPGGGALAVIGHVDRVWAYSFLSDSKAQRGVFEATFKRLLEGYPVGAAMSYFGMRYSQLAADLMGLLQRARIGEEVDPREVASLWTAHNDAKAYAVLGDPAVRLTRSEGRA